MSNGIDLNKMPFVYWSPVAIMSYIQRRIIVYSIMYYNMSQSCVSDRYYDAISKQLCGLQKQYPEQFKHTEYYYAMYDFDGTTGFNIPSRLNKSDLDRLTSIASVVLLSWQVHGGKML